MGWLKNIRNEIKVIRERDPAIHSDMEVFLYPSFKVMLHYRIAHKLYQKKHYFFARWISQRAVRKTGIEIHPGAQIGENFFIDHGNGVIIGETAIVGNNVTLYQGVTLGGTGKEHGNIQFVIVFAIPSFGWQINIFAQSYYTQSYYVLIGRSQEFCFSEVSTGRT